MRRSAKRAPFLGSSLCLAAGVLLVACDGGGPPGDEPAPPIQQSAPVARAATAAVSAREGPAARAELSPTEGSDVEGVVEFHLDSDGKMTIVAEAEGLDPGAHGFHVHEKGDCSAPDASSAGGHFAPDRDPHGAPTDDPSAHHAGDLGNLIADESGKVTVTLVDEELTLDGRMGVVGRAVVVHRGKDDLESQPSGDAGGRVACGVIREQGAPVG